jgi:hypothetical protein
VAGWDVRVFAASKGEDDLLGDGGGDRDEDEDDHEEENKENGFEWKR